MDGIFLVLLTWIFGGDAGGKSGKGGAGKGVFDVLRYLLLLVCER